MMISHYHERDFGSTQKKKGNLSGSAFCANLSKEHFVWVQLVMTVTLTIGDPSMDNAGQQTRTIKLPSGSVAINKSE